MEKYPSVELVLHLPHSIYNGLCLDEHLNAGSKEIMMAGMKFASGFNIKKLTLHLGHIDKNVNREIYYDKLVPILRELCDYADKFNQIIMIENMPGSNEFGYSPEEILKLIKLVNKNNLKFIFDTGHAHVSEFDDFSYLYYSYRLTSNSVSSISTTLKIYDLSNSENAAKALTGFVDITNAEVFNKGPVTFENVQFEISVSPARTYRIYLAPLTTSSENSKLVNITVNATYKCIQLPNGFDEKENFKIYADKYITSFEETIYHELNFTMKKGE